MPFVPSYTVEQLQLTPNILRFTDTSSDFTAKRIYLRKSDGTYLVPNVVTTNYINWGEFETQIDIDVLDKDYSFVVIVEWVDGGGNVLYSLNSLNCFSKYSENFSYNLTTAQANSTTYLNDEDYDNNRMILSSEIQSAKKCVELFLDIKNSQLCLDRAKFIMDGKTSNF